LLRSVSSQLVIRTEEATSRPGEGPSERTITRTGSGWISRQVRRVKASIRREMKHRAALDLIIGHVKVGHRTDRNFFQGLLSGDITVVTAANRNFGLLLR
jgi:hypothetical protein